METKKQRNIRIVICAHIDTKKGTPGALDNGTGIAVLLTLADLLKAYDGKYGVELLALNGEDYYAAPGQMQYLAQNAESFDQIVLAVNIDGAGCKGYKTSYCVFNCEGESEQLIREVFERPENIRIDPWYQGDHMLFAMNRVPAVAISSENPYQIAAKLAHTPMDTVENTDAGKILEIANTLKALIHRLGSR